MAGTLTVQNLQGPTSGANANKIIVPSGQTLDVSGGTLTPSAGQVVQTVQDRSTSDLQTTSTSAYSEVVQGTITLANTSNAVLVTINGMVYKRNNANGTLGSGLFTLTANGTVIPEAEFSQYSNTSNYLYWLDAGSAQFIYHMSRTYLHYPSSTSPQTFSWGIISGGGGNVQIYRGAQIILQEIAQ